MRPFVARYRVILAVLVILLLVVGLSALIYRSARRTSWGPSRWVLRVPAGDVNQGAKSIAAAILRQAQGAPGFPQGYPQMGHIETTPQPQETGVQVMHCIPDALAGGDGDPCILLSDRDDFVRLQAVTWPSAAAHRLAIYVLSNALFARVDPVQNYVALDIFTFSDYGLGERTDAVIRKALGDLPAKEYRP